MDEEELAQILSQIQELAGVALEGIVGGQAPAEEPPAEEPPAE